MGCITEEWVNDAGNTCPLDWKLRNAGSGGRYKRVYFEDSYLLGPKTRPRPIREKKHKTSQMLWLVALEGGSAHTDVAQSR